jgi:hypothetical protein
MPLSTLRAASSLMRALMGLGRASEAAAVAEEVFSVLSVLGCAGCHEVAARLAASESIHASGNLERARAELRETLRQIELRADDISDPFWKESYLTRNRNCVRAQQLGKEWGL